MHNILICDLGDSQKSIRRASCVVSRPLRRPASCVVRFLQTPDYVVRRGQTPDRLKHIVDGLIDRGWIDRGWIDLSHSHSLSHRHSHSHSLSHSHSHSHTPIHEGGGASRRLHTGGRRFAPPPCVDSFMDGCVAACTMHIFLVCTMHIFLVFTMHKGSPWGHLKVTWGPLRVTFSTVFGHFSDFLGVVPGVFRHHQ